MEPHAPPHASMPESRFVGALDVPVDLPLATVGTRGIAALIDALVVILLELFTVALVTLGEGSLPEAGRYALAGLVIALFVVPHGYFVLLEAMLDGQTLGKRALGIRVVESDGTRLGTLGALIRNMLRIADFLPLGYGIGVAGILATRRCQRLGDLAAGTLVVREETGGPPRETFTPPPGLDATGIALLEEYVALRRGLVPERREQVATAIIRWLGVRHPGIATRLSRTGSPAEALERLLTAGPPPGPARD